ncbi:N-acetylmuramoyl-L-alanine amidase [Oceanospirillum multiglobuliferum]|uniref:N-acetylmuramoyl-L-alanine amidase AmiC n=1 Tax=Oceanospirillum multiglobuliferum TaxID=64969 RepID=A0A1T4RIJ0_9GAMM|nr:N-acetylmuramoyl-L-alanine amidase [Oceanospirillum multiglobuliferum]OPX54788.1 N-acetylmuramoyl-L-alanine amidase [Oceanospirillum multiglobuliferum]SKA15578.1 N-acetylmuramoyl-L-alanine amidase [Oceanospirillum multiglobuliferum]
MALFSSLSKSRALPILAFAGVMLSALTAQAASIKNVRIWPAPDHTRLVFDLDKPTEHKVFSLSNPNRLVIDLDGMKSEYDIDTLPVKDTPISNIRTAVKNGQDLRVVLDLKRAVQPRSFLLKPNKQYGDRLVIDLVYQGAEAEAQKTAPKVVAKTETQSNSRTNSPKATPSTSTTGEKRDIIIAIDAGHGGEDPGAIGPNRVREKTVVLAIAKKVEQLLRNERGFKPVLIRTGDYYIGLRDRTERARKYRADLLISIHADAYRDHRPMGSSVFALSQRGATSETARWLADSENSADLIGGVDGALSLDDKDRVLAEVLLDLTMTATLSDSLKVGQSVLGSIGNVNKLHKKEVEQAAFMVLKSPDIPSILIETGFISNPQEAKNLQNTAYQRKMAHSIVQGIQAHFKKNPPPDSLLAYEKKRKEAENNAYVVSRGDTLSAIAYRQKVSVDKIRKANNLRSDTLFVGQRLHIPRS